MLSSCFFFTLPRYKCIEVILTKPRKIHNRSIISWNTFFVLLSALPVNTHTCLFWSETHIRLMCSISLQAIFVYTFSTANLSKNRNISSDYYLPFGVIGVNFSLSSCVGDTLLLLLLLCGDDKADTAFPCESIVRTDEFSVVAVARGAPQKFKSNLLPVKRTSRSRRASRSLSKCNCKEKE